MAENYIGFEKSLNLDELLANPATPVRLENVSVSGGEFQRGCILAGASGIFAPPDTQCIPSLRISSLRL